MKPNRLYIYDEVTDRHGRHDEDSGIVGMMRAATTVKLPIKDESGLHNALAQLVSEGKTFRRVLWMTHGGPGRVRFGKDRIFSETLGGANFVGKGYEKLFPQPTKMYFSGCNVAESDDGWRFLESAGNLFLHGGGYTMAWTSTGYGWDEKVFRMIMSSHTLHFSGYVRIVTFSSGGRVLERLSYDGDWLSSGLLDMVNKAKILKKLSKIVPDDF